MRSCVLTGRAQGFAYVEFESDDDVVRATEKDGQEVKGRRLSIAKSAPPGAGRGRGGGRGAARGGFGGGRSGGFEGRGGGGRGRGRDGGGGGGGGGRFGLGYQPVTTASAALMGHQKRHLDVAGEGGGDQQQAKPVTGLVPRALVAKHAAGDEKPKSNADFKALFKKPPAAE